MNLEDTIKRNNALMQNMADAMETISKSKKLEESPNRGNDHGIEELKKELNKHYNNVSDAITKLMKSTQNSFLESSLKEANLKIDVVLKTIADFEHKDKITHETHKKEIIIFGKDAVFTTKQFLLMVGILVVLVSCIKYLSTFYDHFSSVKKERDTYYTFYHYYNLKFIKDSSNVDLGIIENTLKLIQNQDSSFMKNYNDMEEWLKKDLKIKSLKDELKKIEP